MAKRVVTTAMMARTVALTMGVPLKQAILVCEGFVNEIQKELVEMNVVKLHGVGSFNVYAQKGATSMLKPMHSDAIRVKSRKKHRVSFRKSPKLRELIKERYGDSKVEKVMDKLGVDEQQVGNEKLAAQGCPECGAKVERHGNVLACPTHGTEPFEKKGK